MSAAAIVNPKLAAASFGKAIQPLLTGQERYAQLGVRLVAYAFPFLDVDLDWHAHGRTIRLRVDGADYPYRPVGGGSIHQAGVCYSAKGRCPLVMAFTCRHRTAPSRHPGSASRDGGSITTTMATKTCLGRPSEVCPGMPSCN